MKCKKCNGELRNFELASNQMDECKSCKSVFFKDGREYKRKDIRKRK
jgi:hypothetical protein